MMKEGEKADAAFYEPGKSCRELLDELEKPCRELWEEVEQGIVDSYLIAAGAIKKYYEKRIAEIEHNKGVK